MSKHHFQGQTVWITGASAGIGRAVAVELSRRGANVVLSARRESKLQEVAEECPGDGVLIEPLDVTDSQRNVDVVESISETFGGLDVAFFNAGVFGSLGGRPFDAETFEWNMKVNFLGTVYGIEAALPHLRDSDRGYVVGMSSIAAYAPLARGSAYGASKAATKYMLDSLDFEWEEKGVDVDVSVVCPGEVATPMTEDDSFPYEPVPAIFQVSPEWAARYIVDNMERRRHEIRFPVVFALIFKLLAILPRPIHRLCLRIMSKMNVSEEF